MREKLLLITAVLLLLFCCVPALAESQPEGPVDPERLTMEAHAQVTVGARPTLMVTKGLLRTAVEGVTWSTKKSAPVAFDSSTVFTVTPSDGGEYLYEFYFGERNSVFGKSWVVYRQRISGLNTFALCPIVVPGEYQLVVNIYAATDTQGKSTLKQLLYYYTVEEDEDHPSLDAICDGVLAECLGATPFDTALNLHDWITHHADYDSGLQYYGADGVLVRGFGTCDSYSKAYYLLLQKAGIPVNRVSGNNHAWNQICLDGVWYQVDPTWDDPTGGTEYHEYFCITDELMQASGHTYTLADYEPCESLTMNYFAVRGGWEDWQIGFLDELRAGMQLGRPGLGVKCPGETLRHLTILCWILNEQPQWSADMADGQDLTFHYNYGDTVFSAALTDAGTVSGYWLYAQTGDAATAMAWLGVRTYLEIPATLGGRPVTSIGDRAFRGDTRLVDLTVPNTLLSVGEQALDGCANLTGLELPDTVTAIGAQALPEGMLLTCARDGALARALGGAGYAFTDNAARDWKLRWVEDGVLAALRYTGTAKTASLPEGVNGLGAMDLGSAQLLRANPIVWTDTDAPSLNPPAIVLCGSASQALQDWCGLNSVILLTNADKTILPAVLSAIEPEAFTGAAFRWVVIPDGCVSVGAGAFADCSGLRLVTVPASVTSIGDGAFESGVYFLTPPGSYADGWAGANGLISLAE